MARKYKHDRYRRFTWNQIRQQELAWLLYITEGHRANLEKALAVNCVTFNADEKHTIRESIAAQEETAELLRRHLQNIG